MYNRSDNQPGLCEARVLICTDFVVNSFLPIMVVIAMVMILSKIQVLKFIEVQKLTH